MTAQKTVVVTGASSGIGASLARLLASQGHQVVLAARRETELAKVAQDCAGKALVVVADLTRRADAEKVARAAIEKFGGFDVWVNNAGRGISRMPSQLTDADLDDMMSVNVKSALYGMQAALPHFQARGAGHLINVSSMLGRIPFAPIRSAYSGAKHFLNALTACMRQELATSHPGIQVSLVSPGVVATDFGLNALHGGMDSRSLPNAQNVDEVAQVIARTIETRRADVYTQPGAAKTVAGYFAEEDLAVAEARLRMNDRK
ncbi:MAG: SDR family NAD(P)-dependent oxidoreductase [Myxococcaceae bacterium]|nr:SDR family NAD(P)-dependent oxidoreductase [Myxococcaceae bacterium]